MILNNTLQSPSAFFTEIINHHLLVQNNDMEEKIKSFQVFFQNFQYQSFHFGSKPNYVECADYCLSHLKQQPQILIIFPERHVYMLCILYM